MKKIQKILIIIQRSNGDVLLSLPLINALHNFYPSADIDLLVNDDTFSVADLLPHIKNIHIFSYQRKKDERIKQELSIILSIYRKYDLSINLTSSDRSVLYAILASKKSISAVEKNNKKSWWKKYLLTLNYSFDLNKHILVNNLEPLRLLNIEHDYFLDSPKISEAVTKKVRSRIKKMGVKDFIILHLSAQYNYKIYPQHLRDKLLSYLNNLNVTIVLTGSNSDIDLKIKEQLPSFPNIVDLIGVTSLEEYFALSELSIGYIGMDTLNMHIAAAQNKRIFAIFGPTKLALWSPWCNVLKKSATEDIPFQTYGNISIFQARMPCVACGKAGCDDLHGESECLNNIDPKVIFKEVENWLLNKRLSFNIPVEASNEFKPKKIVLFIVYGEDEGYYNGAKFSLLTFMNWYSDNDSIQIVILTERPSEFKNYPVTVLPINKQQKRDWSVNGKYHFRIKNRGMAYVMDKFKLNNQDKILFFDTDTYFKKSPLALFDYIRPDQALFYLNEGFIYKRKRFNVYIESLQGKKLKYDGGTYELTKKSAMWGSLMIGLMPNMRSSLEWADKLLIKFIETVPSHTIEPFSLSESLLKKFKIVEGKKLVSLYSTSRKKKYALKVIAQFFLKNSSLPINEQILMAQKVKIKRSITTIIKQRFF